MSDSITNQENESRETNLEKQEEQYVAKKAFEEVSGDMHKYKTKYREAAAERAKLESMLKQQEKERLEKEKKFEELYKQAEDEKSQLIQKIESERAALNSQRKKSALKEQLGNIKDDYLSLANLDAIEVDENGTVSSESVLALANSFKQQYPELVPGGSSDALTSQAAPIGSFANSSKSINEMSIEELKEELLKNS